MIMPVLNIFVFGGNRFVGKALVEALLPNNNITVFNRKGTGPNGVEVIRGDRNIPNDISKIDFSEYDLILDFCLFKPEQFNIISNFIPNNTNYIFISSASANKESWGEYGKDKKECEILVKSYFTNYKIIRPPYIDGENSHRPRTAQIINQILNDKPVTIAGDGDYGINITWVDDVVNFLYDLILKNNYSPEVIELANSKNYSMNEYVKFIAKFLNKDFIIEKNSEHFWAPSLDLTMGKNEYCNNFNAIDNKLKEFLEWYNEKGKEKYGYN